MGYTIKLAAEKTHLSPNTLRYYEKEGLLLNVARTKSGIRSYSDQDLELLGLISCLKNTDMSIRQIRDFVNSSHQGPETLKERCELLIAHKCEVEKRMEEMQQHLEKVAHKIDHYTKEYEEYQLENKQ